MIVTKLDVVVKRLNFSVMDVKVENAWENGWEEKEASSDDEVFKMVPKVTMIEFSKFVGDTSEYKELCEEYVRLVLKDIIYNYGCPLDFCQIRHFPYLSLLSPYFYYFYFLNIPIIIVVIVLSHWFFGLKRN